PAGMLLPVTVTVAPAIAAPGEAGDVSVMGAGSAPTENPAARIACSVPVVTVIFLGPAALPATIAICAWALVGLVTATGPSAPAAAPPTPTPAPKLACVVPCTKWVPLPVITT